MMIEAILRVERRLRLATFTPKEHVENFDARYIKVTLNRKTSESDFAHFVDYLKKEVCITTAAPFQDVE